MAKLRAQFEGLLREVGLRTQGAHGTDNQSFPPTHCDIVYNEKKCFIPTCQDHHQESVISVILQDLGEAATAACLGDTGHPQIGMIEG